METSKDRTTAFQSNVWSLKIRFHHHADSCKSEKKNDVLPCFQTITGLAVSDSKFVFDWNRGICD